MMGGGVMKALLVLLTSSTAFAAGAEDSAFWKAGMDWLNLFILLVLAYRYLFIPGLQFLDKSISDIEVSLNREERDKKELLERTNELKALLAGVDAKGAQLLSEAEQDAVKARDMILAKGEERAREVHAKMLEDVKNYSAQALHDLQIQFCDELLGSAKGTLTGRSEHSAFEARMESQLEKGAN